MLLKRRRNPDGGWIFMFWCPACKELHPYIVKEGEWQFNGNWDKPSFTPSLKYDDCHLFVGSYYTYSDLRHSTSYLYVFIVCSLLNSYIWVSSSRKINDDGLMIFYSLIWDLLMVLVYYVVPLLLKSEKLGGEAIAAAIATIASLVWLKSSL